MTNNNAGRWVAMCRTGLACLVLLFVAGPIILPAPAAADDTDDLRKLCDNARKSPDTGIPACTRLLDPKRSGVNGSAVYLQRGNAWFALGNYDSAITDYGNAINLNPQFVDAYMNRGQAWFKKGDFDRAIKEFSDAIRLNPGSARAYHDRGFALYSKDEWDLAIKDFSKAIELDPKFASAYNNRGLVWHGKRSFDNAIADFDQVIKLAPGDPGALINRAAALIDKGDTDRAISDYSEAIRLDPKNARAYFTRGEGFRLKGDIDHAKADLDEAIRLDPRSFEAYNNRARLWRDKRDYDRAIDDYGEAILLNPQYADGYAGRGEIWRLKEDYKRSLADLTKAATLVPKTGVYFYLRGETLREMGDADRAIADDSEAVRLLPDAVAAYVGRGLAYEKRGDVAKAKDDFERALKLPSVADAETAKPAQAVARSRLDAMAAASAAAASAAAASAAAAAAAAAAPPKPPEQVVAKLEPPLVLPDPGRRIALVIGNSAYTAVAALANPKHDAEAMADTLRKVGFQSVTLETDAGKDRLMKALRAFGNEAEHADWAVIYYAGHGIEMNGTNYLVPVDATLETDRDMDFEAVSLDLVMTTVERAKKLHLVLLDACRDNPFARTMRRSTASRSIGRGLASVEPDAGTVVVYAAKHGDVALDGDGTHSPFAAALIKEIVKPGVELRRLFDIVRDDVMDATGRHQQPFTYGSLPGREDFVFALK